MYRLILAVVLVALLVSVFSPVIHAGNPGGQQGGMLSKARAKFFRSNQSVQTGVPRVRANDLTTAEGRSVFRAPSLGTSRLYDQAAGALTNTMRANSQEIGVN